jgi:hypothetical protein
MNMDIDQDVDAAGAFAAIFSNKQGHGSRDGRDGYPGSSRCYNAAGPYYV